MGNMKFSDTVLRIKASKLAWAADVAKANKTFGIRMQKTCTTLHLVVDGTNRSFQLRSISLAFQIISALSGLTTTFIGNFIFLIVIPTGTTFSIVNCCLLQPLIYRIWSILASLTVAGIIYCGTDLS